MANSQNEARPRARLAFGAGSSKGKRRHVGIVSRIQASTSILESSIGGEIAASDSRVAVRQACGSGSPLVHDASHPYQGSGGKASLRVVRHGRNGGVTTKRISSDGT